MPFPLIYLFSFHYVTIWLEDDDEEEEEEEEVEETSKGKKKGGKAPKVEKKEEKKKAAKPQTAQELSDLIHLKAIHSKGYEQSKGKCLSIFIILSDNEVAIHPLISYLMIVIILSFRQSVGDVFICWNQSK